MAAAPPIDAVGPRPDSLLARSRDALRTFPFLDAALALSGAVVILSWAGLAFSHLHDRYQVNFASGVNAALALRLNQGDFYPPVFDGAHYGGTRYMPLTFALHAGLARLTGEYLVSGKLLTTALTFLLCLELFIILRGLKCSLGASLALIGLLLLTQPAFLAATTIRGDLLPVVLQLAALMIVRKFQGRRGVAVAALVCVAAVLAKASALWAPCAIALALLSGRRWGRAALFAGLWLGGLSAALASLHWITDGRMHASFAVCAVVIEGPGLLLAPLNLVYRLGKAGVAAGVLAPMLVLGCATAVRTWKGNLYHVAALCSLPILLVVYADNGSDYNHLLDLLILAVPIAGGLWASLRAEGDRAVGARAAAALVVCWALFSGWTTVLEGGVREAVYSLRGGPTTHYPVKPLADEIGDHDTVFSEDPWVQVARGQTPTLLDPFALSLLARKHPETIEPLVRRLRRGEFSKVVLLRQPGSASSTDWHLWYGRHLGGPILRAITERYEFQREIEGYFVFAPKAAEGGSARADAS
jgi:hypothetical protein